MQDIAFVKNIDQVMVNVRTWNEDCQDPVLAEEWRVRTIRYFVKDNDSENFAPSKYCAYRHKDGKPMSIRFYMSISEDRNKSFDGTAAHQHLKKLGMIYQSFSNNSDLKEHFTVWLGRNSNYISTGVDIDQCRYLVDPKESVPSKEITAANTEKDLVEEYREGERKLKEVKVFQRNQKLVEQAKQHYGYECQACGFNFAERYGELGKSYIECHHLTPLSEQSEEEHKTTLEDVTVLCSNCHRMIHRGGRTLTMDVLKSFIHKEC